MKGSEIEAYDRKHLSLLIAVGFTFLLIVFRHQEGGNYFDLKKFNPDFFNLIIFLFFLVICLFWWLKVFDKRPVLKVNHDGIWSRSSAAFFSKPVLIAWNDVKYFYVLKETRKLITHSLVIGQKQSEKEKRIEISGLDKSITEILNVLKSYSATYDFHYLGNETKP
jgi:hypothetical protein